MLCGKLVLPHSASQAWHVGWARRMTACTMSPLSLSFKVSGSTGQWSTQPVAGTATSCTVSGLSPAQEYAFRVAAVTATGDGALSDQVTARSKWHCVIGRLVLPISQILLTLGRHVNDAL